MRPVCGITQRDNLARKRLSRCTFTQQHALIIAQRAEQAYVRFSRVMCRDEPSRKHVSSHEGHASAVGFRHARMLVELAWASRARPAYDIRL
jgi:hypothetical protein